VIWGEAVSRDGISDGGKAVAADAPPVSDRETPTVSLRSLLQMWHVESSRAFSEYSTPVSLLLRFALARCKSDDASWHSDNCIPTC
jgi:hypothetical protein